MIAQKVNDGVNKCQLYREERACCCSEETCTTCTTSELYTTKIGEDATLKIDAIVGLLLLRHGRKNRNKKSS